MHDATVVGESRQVVKHVSAVLALVDLVPPVSLNVRAEIVSSGVAAPAYVTGERLFPRVYAHVPTEVRGADELATAHLADERPVRFLLLQSRVAAVGGVVHVLHDNNLRLNEVIRHRLQQRVVLGCRHGSEEVEIAAGSDRLVGRGRRRGRAQVPVPKGALHLGHEGRGLGRRMTGGRMVLPPVTVKVGGAVKFLSAEETFVHVHVTVQDSVTVEVVGPVEALPTHLAQKPLVIRIGVSEDVPLELVLPVEPHPAHEAGDSHLFVLAWLGRNGRRAGPSTPMRDYTGLQGLG